MFLLETQRTGTKNLRWPGRWLEVPRAGPQTAGTWDGSHTYLSFLRGGGDSSTLMVSYTDLHRKRIGEPPLLLLEAGFVVTASFPGFRVYFWDPHCSSPMPPPWVTPSLASLSRQENGASWDCSSYSHPNRIPLDLDTVLWWEANV